MHSCEVTRERLCDLLFEEAAGAEAQLLRAELEACAACVAEYRSLAATLDYCDAAAESVEPAAEFWPGYEERLMRRLADEFIEGHDAPTRTPESFVRAVYRPTILEDAGLARRLSVELRAAARASRLTWPEFRRDPAGFAWRMTSAYAALARRFFAREYATTAALAPLCVLLLVCAAWLAASNRCLFLSRFGGRCEQTLKAPENADLQLVGMLDVNSIPGEQKQPDAGPAGLNEGRGGGSKAKQERPGGGGGGGNRNPAPVSYGKTAPGRLEEQLIAPNVRRPTVSNPQLAVSPTLKGDPLLLPEDTRALPFGDPKSLSQVPSDGPGTGGGQGTGQGSGQGPGEGRGYGAGRDENTGGGDPRYGGAGVGGPDGGGPEVEPRVFKQHEVTRRARLISKPDPGFTEEARKLNVTGTVRLRAVLSAAGTVTNITVMQGLPGGLTERAIMAARSIRFEPAQRDGRPVSQWVTLEYNFNIY